MKTIAIHYFTGTGNTAHAVKLIAEQLKAAGMDATSDGAVDEGAAGDETASDRADYEITIVQVKKGISPFLESFDYHIFAFPVLSWAAPALMKRYMRKMPMSANGKTTSAGTKTAILAINGSVYYNGNLVKGYTGQALEQAEGILRRKNYDVFLTANASFPDNWTQATNPCSKEDSALIFPHGNAEVKQFADDFIAGKRELYRCGTFNKIWSWTIAFLFGLIGRRVLGKFFIADETCTGCGICAKQCPSNTIRMDNSKPHKRPYWGINCEDCNRCINICPERAIQVSGPLLIILFGINIGLTLFAYRAIAICTALMIHLDKVPKAGVEILLDIIATLVLLWLTFVPIEAFFRLMLRIPGFRRFFGKNYTKKFRRYMAPE